MTLAAAGAGVAACGARGNAAQVIRNATAADTAAGHDPCTLLTADEAAPYVGPIGTPPFRASDGAPDVRGDQCMYRGKDGRELAITPDWSSGGATAAGSAQDAADRVGAALNTAAGGGAGDTMAHRVVKPELNGPWDQASWIPGGALFASRGTRSVQVDVTGASGKEDDALAVARIIMPRFDHPLSYDGAKAVALAPRPPAHSAAACDFLPRSDVERAIGPLAGTPTADAPETNCTYTVSTSEGKREYAVEFTWQGGQKNFAMLEHGMATVGDAMGTPTSSPLDTMTPPPQMKAMIGGMMKMVGGASAEKNAPGSASTNGFRTDTGLTGPWDRAALLHGTQLIAVRHDVFVGIDLQSADYEKAKALLTAIMSRL
jgi:hypothetical protein